MAAPFYVRDKTRDKTRSKTYGKVSVKERRNEEIKRIRGMTMKQVARERRTTGGGHMGKIVTDEDVVHVDYYQFFIDHSSKYVIHHSFKCHRGITHAKKHDCWF